MTALFDFKNIVDSVRGKKSVKVRQHKRRVRGTPEDTDVRSHIKLIDLVPKNSDEVSIHDIDNFEDADKKTDLDDTPVDEFAELATDEIPSLGVDIDLNADIEEDDGIIENVSNLEIEELKKIKEDEIVPLILDWQTNKNEDSLKKVLDYYNNIFVFHANKHKTGPIPYNLVLLRAKQLGIIAATKYQTGKGTRFNTFLTWYLKKLYRFVNDNKNIAKIPEQRVRKVTAYKDAYATLQVKHEREPTDIELADYLSWPVKEVARLRNELSRREILNFGEETSYSDLGIYNTNLSSALKLVHIDAPPEEQYILEHITEGFGKPQKTLKELSKDLKMSESKIKYLISNLKMKILENV